ncbi:MAG: SH3 domain-containing protein [Anaerolineae bacterium]|nr:SH3 domain-containing protein [Anaerolineae bacterium]MDQ7033744.1 SH3 domain-containing protein [Anaerolineae bacterium]
MRRWVVGLLILLVAQVISAQSGIRVVVVNEFQNIRISPALGATVIDTVNAGFVFDTIDARSGDSQWLRIQYQCSEGWINLAPLVILDGDINSLPTADPRSVPFGGFESPRSGFTDQQGAVTAAATDGLRVRSGPSRAYPTLANINFNQAFTITGRNDCGNWYQVNFEGTLGWVSSAFVQILGGDVFQTPVGGIVAQTAPPSGESRDDYIAMLRLLRDRIIIAQESLNDIRASWTDAALQGRATCQAYPPRPSNINVPTPMLAAFFVPLDTLVTDFNDAMFNTRQAIDIFIQVCNQPGTANPVGQATVQGALGIINLAEQQYAALLQRLAELIPDDNVGPDECLLVYNNKSEILPRIGVGTIYLDDFNRRTFARGYCFDAIETQILVLQTLPIPESDLDVFVAISALDDPSNFLLVNQASDGQSLTVGPLVMTRSTTYLLIIADLGSEGRAPIGQFAFLLSDVTFGTGTQNLAWDPATGSVILEDAVQTSQTTIGPDGLPVVDTGGSTSPTTVCPSLSFTCNDFFTCEEAQACYDAGNFLLDDEDNVLNGIPCEQSVCFGVAGN